MRYLVFVIMAILAMSCNEVKADGTPKKAPRGSVCHMDWHTGRVSRKATVCWVTDGDGPGTIVPCKTLRACQK